MTYRLIAALLSTMIFLSSATYAVPVDEPWNSAELQKRLTANLVLNGSLDIPFDGHLPDSSNNFLPCWNAKGVASQITASDGKISIDPTAGDATFSVQAIRYYFRENEHDYKIFLKGSFLAEGSATVTAEECDTRCTNKEYKLSRESNSAFGGIMPAPKAGKYIKSFTLRTPGFTSIDSFSVSSGDELIATDVRDRDIASLKICNLPDFRLADEPTAIGIVTIALANGVYLAVMATLLWRRNYFPLFILFPFYITNVAGVGFLYFGLSEQRLIQGATNRHTFIKIAWIDLALLCAGSLAFCLTNKLTRLWPKTSQSPNSTVSAPLTLVIYCTITALFLLSILPQATQYYLALWSDPSHASYLRNQSVTSTFGLKPHYYWLLFRHIPILLSLILFSKAFGDGHRTLAACVIIFQSFLLLSHGEKAPLVWYIYAAFFVAVINGNLRFRDVAIPLGMSAALLLLGAMLLRPESVFMLIDRTLFGTLTVAYHALEAFPQHNEYLNGRSMRFFGFGVGEAFNLEVFLWRRIFPEKVFSDISGTSPGAFWVQTYANFGAIIAIASAAVIGVAAAVANGIATTIFSRALGAGLLGWLVYSYASLGETAFTRFAADFYLISVFIFAGILAFASSLIENRNSKN